MVTAGVPARTLQLAADVINKHPQLVCTALVEPYAFDTMQRWIKYRHSKQWRRYIRAPLCWLVAPYKLSFCYYYYLLNGKAGKSTALAPPCLLLCFGNCVTFQSLINSFTFHQAACEM